MEISLSELSEVKGIGKKTIQRIREHKLADEGYISEYDEKLHLDRNSVNQGDCLELMNGIPNKSVDMILADLPYGTTQNKWDSVIPLDKLWVQYERIIKKDGAIILTADGEFTFKLYNSNPKLFRYKLVWNKKLPTGFLNANRMPLRQNEDILVFYKKLPTYNPQMRKGKYRNKGGATVNNGCYGDFEKQKYNYNDEYYPTSIIEIHNANQSKKQHQTQKPIALFEYLIKTYTNKGDLVLDNVAGSGTTGVACQNTDRDYILIEQEQKYINVIKERLES